MIALAVQIVGSLIAILVLALLARHLKLGGDERISGEDHARQLAREAWCGFDPVTISVDRVGYGALLRDDDGRIMLLRRHGSHFVARQVDQRSLVRLDQQYLTIAFPDRHFSPVTLDLGMRAQVWAASFRTMDR